MKNKKIVHREVPDNINLPDLIHPVLKRVYASRNIKSSKDLDYSLSSLIPFKQLSGINDAVILLQEMLEQKKRILIVADFDADKNANVNSKLPGSNFSRILARLKFNTYICSVSTPLIVNFLSFGDNNV